MYQSGDFVNHRALRQSSLKNMRGKPEILFLSLVVCIVHSAGIQLSESVNVLVVVPTRITVPGKKNTFFFL